MSDTLASWRQRTYWVIFEADTRAGRLFDLWLIGLIIASVLVVMADSVEALHHHHGTGFMVLEWLFTLIFTVEYLARLWCHPKPATYARSFFGVIDLVSLLPTYIGLFFPEIYALVDVRVLRLLRVFRILKLAAYVAEYQALSAALVASRRKILVFITAVMMLVVIMGTVMYVVEGPSNGFHNIPTSIYWAITTMTTVGFGDITPKTDFGRFIASVMMLMGWGTLAVPTGIVTTELAFHSRRNLPVTTRHCPHCAAEGHRADAKHCFACGQPLPDPLADAPR